jgi:CHRD domain
MPTPANFAAMFAVALSITCASAPAHAEMVRFTADLLPVAGTGSQASGNLVADYDTDSKKLTWSGSYKGVATYATSASFHGAAAGPRRGVVRVQTIDSPFQGSAILGEKQAEGLLAGEWSLVVRTAGFPKGELRGQLVR